MTNKRETQAQRLSRLLPEAMPAVATASLQPHGEKYRTTLQAIQKDLNSLEESHGDRQGSGMMETDNRVIMSLLAEALESLSDGLEDGPMESDASIADRALVARIKAALSPQGGKVPLKPYQIPTDFTAGGDEDREMFEQWVREEIDNEPRYLYRRDSPGSERLGQYVNETIESHWIGWHACAERMKGRLPAKR